MLSVCDTCIPAAVTDRHRWYCNLAIFGQSPLSNIWGPSPHGLLDEVDIKKLLGFTLRIYAWPACVKLWIQSPPTPHRTWAVGCWKDVSENEARDWDDFAGEGWACHSYGADWGLPLRQCLVTMVKLGQLRNVHLDVVNLGEGWQCREL